MTKLKVALGSGVALACALAVASSFAGIKYEVPVRVCSGGACANGSIGTARNSANSNEKIGCSVAAPDAQTGGYSVFCSAQSPTFNDYTSCYSTNALHAYVVMSIGEGSYIHFNRDSSGKCTYISVTNTSEYAPKVR